MKRLTVHIKNAKKERVEVPEKGEKKGSKKTINKEKIFNTISVRHISKDEDLQKHLKEIRSLYTIDSWENGEKRGKEMIYIANEK